MVLLDNSPVLAAYGMVRSGCCKQSRWAQQRAHSAAGGGGSGGESAQVAHRLPSPFQKFQQQQQQQQLLLMMMNSADWMQEGASAATAAGGAGATHMQDLDTNSVARALEVMYYGDQAGLEWDSGDKDSTPTEENQTPGAPTAVNVAAALAAAGARSREAAAPQQRLSSALSAPCGGYRARLSAMGDGAHRVRASAMGQGQRLASGRSIAARHLPLLSARSQRTSVGGESQMQSWDGSKGGAAVRWGDVATMRAKVRGS